MDKTKTYQVTSREGLYIATVKAADELKALYALHDTITSSHPGRGFIEDFDSGNFQSYLLLGRNEGPAFFDYLDAREVE